MIEDLDLDRFNLAHAERRIYALLAEREQYVRLTVCLANLITGKAEAKIVGGCVAVDRAAYDDVPKNWQVGVEPQGVRPDDAPEDAPLEQVVLVRVTPRPHVNGVAKPRLVLPA